MSGKTITITENEALSLKDFISYNFYDHIRSDNEIDSLLYAKNILSVYEKCGGMNEYYDYDGPYKEIN